MIDIISPNYSSASIDEPIPFSHIVVTDGFRYRSGYWMKRHEGAGYFLPDPDEEFEFIYFAYTENEESGR